jgi:hypothetical protein
MVTQRPIAAVLSGTIIALMIVQGNYPVAATVGNPPTNQPNFPQDLAGGRPYAGLPIQATVARIDAPHTDYEIVLTTPDRTGNTLNCTGHVYVYNGNGTLRWSASLPQAPGMGPSVADLNGDGVNDVVVGYGDIAQTCSFGGGVRAFNGVDGTMLWDFATTTGGGHGSVYSTPAIGDVNGDGLPEVVFGSLDYCIYMLDHSGQPLWHFTYPNNECKNEGYDNGDPVYSSPALADLEGDGKLEIVIGSNHTTTSGYLNVLRSDGVIIARAELDEPVYSSPAIADLNNDGVLEIAIGTGDAAINHGRYVQVMHYDPSKLLLVKRLVINWIRNTDGYVPASPALGDLDGDGILDVVVVAPNGDFGTQQGSSVYAWSGSDGNPLFKRSLCDVAGKRYYMRASPVIVDVVGDAAPEIILTYGSEVIILNADGTYYTDHPSNICNDQPSSTSVTYWTAGTLNFIPAIGALDQTGSSAIIVAGAVNTDTMSNYGRLFAWGGHKKTYAPWPQFHRDAAHTGLLDNILPTNPLGLTTTPPTNTLSSARVVRITWSAGGADIGAGLAGYAVVWDHNPETMPGTQIDVKAGVSAITASLGIGTWYAHVRAVDRAGNGARTAIHLGPFLLYTNIFFMPRVARA